MSAAGHPNMSQALALRTPKGVSSQAVRLVRNPPGSNRVPRCPPLPRISGRNVRVALGVLWLLDGALQFQPFMYTKGFFTQIVRPAISGQPGPIASSMTWAVQFAEPHRVVFNTLFALVQIAIGIGLLVPKTTKVALASSFAWGVGVWWFGEGLGEMFTNASPLTGAPGAVILYVLIGALVWPTRRPGHAWPTASRPFKRLGGNLVWAAIWLGMSALWLMPYNRSPGAVHDALKSTAASTGGTLGGIIDAAARVAAGRGTTIAIVLAGASAAVAIGAFSRHRALFIATGIVMSLAYWLLGQGLGGLQTGTATDPNAGPLFVLLALTLTSASTPLGVAHAGDLATVKFPVHVV